MKLPKEIKLTNHARQRLTERKANDVRYNTKNIMRSPVKWYGKDDLIVNCALYKHCCYTTRKSNQIGYITDGTIEVIYNKNTKIAITILEVKDKFKPITQFIKPEILQIIKRKKELKMETKTNYCLDCGQTNVEITKKGMYAGLCQFCKQRKQNAKSRKTVYIPYIELSAEDKQKVDKRRLVHSKKKSIVTEEPIILEVPDNNTYYANKANQTSIPTKIMNTNASMNTDASTIIQILLDYRCSISPDNLKSIIKSLVDISKIKDILINSTKCDNNIILTLEQSLDSIEKKLRYDWEINGFQEEDDIKFKQFLTWRRTLKEGIDFWKKLYQFDVIKIIQKITNSSLQNDIINTNDTVKENVMKRYRITTESISDLLNTRKPFSRVFWAPNKDIAYKMFTQWMSNKNLREEPSKTVIEEEI